MSEREEVCIAEHVDDKVMRELVNGGWAKSSELPEVMEGGADE